MEKNELHALVGRQFIITGFIQQKLEIVNYIKEGYDNNAPVLMNNRFLHFTAHNLYRSIIVDLGALFSDKKNTHKNNFNQIISNSKYSNSLKREAVLTIRDLIASQKDNIEEIIRLRDKEIAHYDFEAIPATIKFNFDRLKLINCLFETALKIIMICGESPIDKENSVHYSFDRYNQYLRSLKSLINYK
ncbi:hypothetical protein [Mucilaginibacter ginkgonis]|uniref:Uncharacterized protein n=1 Tax=Mucilaginibacter ginkgonis TaxID=2682091 RepID=A0A6I4I351_9SPHI|nr:hypothetical protein [Mucilaginibacter ginkgonis]QQL49258.1 hypothetical protein GO620_013910 [Mucilaginibacter ginkgonis]